MFFHWESLRHVQRSSTPPGLSVSAAIHGAPLCACYSHRMTPLVPYSGRPHMIELTNVTQHYGVRPVLKQINLRIERGELVVIVGPNGMGKTTLLAVMGGVVQPQHGVVAIDGQR